MLIPTCTFKGFGLFIKRTVEEIIPQASPGRHPLALGASTLVMATETNKKHSDDDECPHRFSMFRGSLSYR